MTKRFHLTSSLFFLLLQSETFTFKKTCNIRASEILHDVTPVETWSSKAMGTSVAAYFLYNIRASNFFEGPETFQIYCPPPGQWIQKLNVKVCVHTKYVMFRPGLLLKVKCRVSVLTNCRERYVELN